MRVGLTGGIATGKTTVCRLFAAKGCQIIDADEVAHQLLRRQYPGYAPVLQAFGAEILDSAGEIDRSKLGNIVFADPAKLTRLNELLHPEVFRHILDKLSQITQEEPSRRVIVDASLMIESGFHRQFDRLILVTSTEEQQILRLRSRNGLSEQQARSRIALQMPLADKFRFAHYVIDNSGSLNETSEQVDSIFEELDQSVWTKSH
jgi:dephospho-CoA kinase